MSRENDEEDEACSVCMKTDCPGAPRFKGICPDECRTTISTKVDPAVVKEIVGRLLRRLKAKDLLLVAFRVQQSPPERVFNELVATNGVELEAEHLLKVLK